MKGEGGMREIDDGKDREEMQSRCFLVMSVEKFERKRKFDGMTMVEEGSK